MPTPSGSIETKLKEIPVVFQMLAKNELKKELTKCSSSLTLDPDKIYINISQAATISSETLTEAFLKKCIGEEPFLSKNLAGLYSKPESVNPEDRIQGLEVADVKNIINSLNTAILDSYRQHMDGFWKTKEVPIPQELYVNPISNFLKALIENSSLINRAYQVDKSYPNLKQTVVAYMSQKLKSLYKKDINPDMVCVLLFEKGKEDTSLNLTDFILNGFSCFFLFYSHLFLMGKATIQIDQNTQNTALRDIFQANDILALRAKHKARLDNYWEKNSANYRILAKFSYLKSLFDQQETTFKLAEKNLKLALQAIGLTEEEIRELTDSNEIDPKEISLDILETLSSPKNVEVSSLVFNNQASSDILKICDSETKELLLYIPGYAPAFIEAKNENLLIHWVLHQAQLPDNLSSIASHFPHSSRVIGTTKLDAFLYSDYAKQDSQEEDTTEKIAIGDVFSFMTERQKERLAADLHIVKVSAPLYSPIPNYQSTDSAFFTTIAEALKYIPYLLPNIHKTSSDLYELLPSPYKTAAELVKKGIKEKLNIDIDPDKTFISFSLHEVNPISYDPNRPLIKGQEAKTTIQSLTEAALSNYQENYSPFGFTTIIYQDLSGKREYTESAQLLNILPKDVEEIIQNADLDALHKSKLDFFWNKHTDPVKYFYQDRYLQQVLEVHSDKTLSKENFQILVDVVFYSLSLEEEGLPSLINPHIRIEIVSVDSYQSTDMFVFRNTSKQQVILYIAGNTKAFFPFANYETCICFLVENGKKNAEWQKLLTSHFSIDVQDSVLNSLKLGSYKQSRSSIGLPLLPTDCSFSNASVRNPITTKPIEKSLFEVTQKNIQKRSYLDASAVIVSDRELMLKHLIGIVESIEIALLIPSLAFPILNWVSLAALATEASINLYLAKNADTIKERRLAALSAGFNALELLLIGAFLSLRSLTFSKSQSLSDIQGQTNIRAVTSGRGVQSSLKKSPVSEDLFFDTKKSMQVWQISAPNTSFEHLDVKAWFLDEQFLLFTGKTSKAKHLIISSDGGYFFGSGIVKVPKNTELVALGPHGWSLFDPRTENIAKRIVLPYGIINENAALPTQTAFFPSLFSRSPNMHFHPKEVNIKMLAGTNTPGHIKNYSLTKYQTFEAPGESYLDIAQVINASRHPFPNIYGIGFNPVDVLTVRNRRGKLLPNLEDVFKSLESHGIHYDRITLEFCRSNMFLPKTQPAPKYKPARLY